jgi:hypothetical protein
MEIKLELLRLVSSYKIRMKTYKPIILNAQLLKIYYVLFHKCLYSLRFTTYCFINAYIVAKPIVCVSTVNQPDAPVSQIYLF